MTQSISVFLVRAAMTLLVGMLLSAVIADARAQSMNGYATRPAGTSNSAPQSYLYSQAAAANNSYDAAPVSGGYYAPMGASVGAPLANAPIGNGFEPAPAGYVAGPPQALAPASAAAQPSQQAGPQTSPYGYRSGDGVPLPQQPAEAAQPVLQAQPAAQPRTAPVQTAQPQSAGPQPYGYRLGDGIPLPSQPQIEQQSVPYQPPPAQTAQPNPAAQPNPYGYRPGDGAQPGAQQSVTPQPGPYQPQTAQQPYSEQPQGAPFPHQSASLGRSPERDYVLGNGDKLRLTVFEEADLSGEYTIDGSGYLRLPLVGQVHAAGFTSAQLEGAIANALSQGYLKSPRVSVQVSTYRPFYIIGAVAKPGEYPYVNHMTALNAIALAGGYTPGAVESVVYIRREGSNTEERLRADRSTLVHPGDVVRVNTTFFADAMQMLNPLSTPLSIAAAAAIP
ncbi:MAG TPA: polysaccharide biosynthesis/export family protein [Rhizomicrobium sp.]|nr:polysaccharide biosynthesis/export family protein [Rhizomicrobium sp.]